MATKNMADGIDAATIQELIDKQQIQELALRYCRAIDRHDWPALGNLYHADAQDDHGAMFCGSAQDYIAWLPSMVAKFKATSHQLLNQYIVIQGCYAEGEVYVIGMHLKNSNGADEQIVTGGRYLDRYEKRDGIWKFLHRKAVMDWNEVKPSLQRWPSEAGIMERDPSWDFFQLLGKI